MKFAVVIVAYRGYGDVIDCIRSIRLIPDYPELIIVVDNASPDDTGDLLSQSANSEEYTFMQSKKNNGFAAGCNQGIEQALERGATHIGLINPDTIISDRLYFTQIRQAFLETDYSIVGTYVTRYGTDAIEFGGGHISHPFLYPKVEDMGEKFFSNSDLQIREVDYTTGSSLFFSRNLWEDIGSIDEGYFLYFEETDWCMRAKKQGYKIGIISSVALAHKTSQSVGFRSSLYTRYMIRNYARFALRHARCYELPFWFILYIGFWFPGQAGGYFFRFFFYKPIMLLKKYIHLLMIRICYAWEIWQISRLIQKYKKENRTCPDEMISDADKVFYDRLRCNSVAFAMGFWTTHPELTILKNFPQITGNVLDFGCGTGNLDILSGLIITGLDISPLGISIANRNKDTYDKFNKTQFLCGNILKDIDLPDNRFDAVWSTQTFEHIKDPSEIFKMLKKYAKKSAPLLLTVPYQYNHDDEGHVHHFMTETDLENHLKPHVSRISEIKIYREFGMMAALCNL